RAQKWEITWAAMLAQTPGNIRGVLPGHRHDGRDTGNVQSLGMSPSRAYRAGDTLEDLCRACKADRLHTVVVVDTEGAPIRVVCGFCHSEHNYRGGPRTDASRSSAGTEAPETRRATSSRAPFPIVSDRERTSTMPASE